jgi:hypothetical protein
MLLSKINTSRMSLEIPMQKVFFMILYYFTSYAPLGVGNLADEIGVLHTNPRLYYIPKKTLGSFNTDFGNELYLVEERPSDSQTDLKPSENLMISLVPKIY